MANTTESDWDESSPAISHARRAGAAEILSLRQGVRLRMELEHEDFETAGVGGGHRSGSAVIYHTTSTPTHKPDGNDFLDSADKGRMWIHPTTLVLKVYDGAGNWERPVAAAVDPVLSTFHKEINSASVPQDETSLTEDDVYLVLVYGTTYFSGNSDPVTVSVTVNGVTRTIESTDQPDGQAPFLLPFVVTIAAAGRVRISAHSGVTVISGMTGIKIG